MRRSVALARVHRIPIALAALLLISCAAHEPVAGADPLAEAVIVRTGIEVLADEVPVVLQGRRVGLITNHSAFDRHRVSTIDRMAAHESLDLVSLFAPEHGIRATESGYLPSEVDERTGLPIHSLYGEETRKPTPEMLEGVEALVFDIQDVGVRQYTYISTMALGMQAAREAGIPFVVLDRPNPIGGVAVEGNVLDPEFSSFVGMYPIASRHGMTVGELALMFNEEFGIGADLTVVPVEGWRREMWFDETGLPWRAPSPNLRTLEAATHYPGTVFFEPGNLSEGRGTERPFEQTGAPWLRADEVVREMSARELPGVRFEAVEIEVDPAATRRRYAGQTIPGVRLILTDRDVYEPIATSLRLIDTIRRLHPNEYEWSGYEELLAGTDRLRKAIDQGRLEELLAEWESEAAAFETLRAPYLLYE